MWTFVGRDLVEVSVWSWACHDGCGAESVCAGDVRVPCIVVDSGPST